MDNRCPGSSSITISVRRFLSIDMDGQEYHITSLAAENKLFSMKLPMDLHLGCDR
jgi:hypothetical protein